MVPRRLYLLIEESARELASRLLIAHFALEQGMEVLVVPQWAAWENLHRLPPGIMFFKGNNGGQAVRMEQAKAAGHQVVSLEEEAFGVSDQREIERLYDPLAVACCDMFFAQGRFQADCVMDRFPETRGRVQVTGNPRADLLLSPLSDPLRREAAALRTQHGDFVLFNTNFGSVNPREGDAVSYFESCVRLGVVDPSNAGDMDDFMTWCRWERTNLAALGEVIDGLVARGFPWRIIVRPHPSENIAHWRRGLEGMPGVSVIREDDHHVWTLAARLLVHPSSTTGLEAYIYGQPAVTLCAGDNRWHELYTANLVNEICRDSAAAIDRITRFAAGDDIDEKQADAFERRLEEHVSVEPNRFAAARIADHLAVLAAEARSSQADNGKASDWTGLRAVPVSGSKIDPQAFTAAAIESKLCEIRTLLGAEAKVEVTTMHDGFHRLSVARDA